MPKATSIRSRLPRPETKAPMHGAVRGWLTDWRAEQLLVDFEGNRHGPLLAANTLTWSARTIEAAIATRLPLWLCFDDGDARRPIIVGRQQPVPQRDDATSTRQTPIAVVDGQRVEFAATDEVVLSCGDARITLRRNGRVVIRGAYVETSSSGTNRVKGATVRIN